MNNFTPMEKVLGTLIIITILTTIAMPFVPDLFLHLV